MKWMLLLLAAGVAACARHVVLEPNMVAAQNDPGWTVVREPAASPAPSSNASR
jgi:hypothetical protein